MLFLALAVPAFAAEFEVPPGGQIKLIGDSIVRGYGFGNYSDPSPLRTLYGIMDLIVAENVPHRVPVVRLEKSWQGFNDNGTPKTTDKVGDELRVNVERGAFNKGDWLVYEDAGQIHMAIHPAPWPSTTNMYGRLREGLSSLLDEAAKVTSLDRVLLMTMFDYKPRHEWSEWDAKLDDGIHTGNDAVRDEGKARGVRVIDMNRIMDRANDHLVACGWGRVVGPDGIHPNVYGNYVMSLAILGTLKADLPNWKITRLEKHFRHRATGGDVDAVWGFTKDPTDEERVKLLHELKAIVIAEL